MKYFFTLALLNAAAMAKRKITEQFENEFLSLTATYGRNYYDIKELEKALLTCNDNRRKV